MTGACTMQLVIVIISNKTFDNAFHSIHYSAVELEMNQEAKIIGSSKRVHMTFFFIKQ
jgi:hypothetical protein